MYKPTGLWLCILLGLRVHGHLHPVERDGPSGDLHGPRHHTTLGVVL
jgi:hypothetical protein